MKKRFGKDENEAGSAALKKAAELRKGTGFASLRGSFDFIDFLDADPRMEIVSALFDLIPTPLLCASPSDDRIRLVNHAFAQIFGGPEMASVSDWKKMAYSGAVREQAFSSWNMARTSSGAGTITMPARETRIQGMDGRMRVVQRRGCINSGQDVAILMFEDITDFWQKNSDFQKTALSDPLTGLPGRRSLDACWSRLKKDGEKAREVALLLVDLDNFKPVNDQFGHSAGDFILKAASERLRHCLRDSDLLFRFGGDEFVIIVDGPPSFSVINGVCDRLVTNFLKPFQFRDFMISLGVSIGISLCPRDGVELPALLKHADAALYRVKREGKGAYQWFSEPAF